MVARLISMAVTTPIRLPLISVTSLASMATSVPVPMAKPTSAWASAGASLTPSPTMPTRLPSSWSFCTSCALSSGSTSAKHALDANLARDGAAGALVVAGQHDNFDAELLQRGDGRL